ncbi:MAG: DNA helicase UvrBC [Planctomycetota bacterium]|nr:MAG: DNA helicase UvrBC [Planctomycetota bacterium]REJ93667.1 MAG: DNA helicase UvrBC [Planctomycetota bacterium]REK25716.1 MAG: DNA helicase UvrBC [Planctomycetota bacterium]REK46538.1 MAG: DNA helicase UvrBC [Planctomycetota bacterium]
MSRDDIDDLLDGWFFDDERVVARQVVAADGRTVVQMRLELGLLQMECGGRPDGLRPEGFETYHELLRDRISQHGDAYRLSAAQCRAVERELLQFYHRRVCWLALHEYAQATRDARHSLELIETARRITPRAAWAAELLRQRPLAVFHLAQSVALVELERRGAAAAISKLRLGIADLRATSSGQLADDRADQRFESDDSEVDEFVARLEELSEAIEAHYYPRPWSLGERLRKAIDAEDYELAARIRDELEGQ